MVEEKPLVSILIPNYNKAPYIRETLDSVIAQTYSNWECIVVDDHSTDESWGILEEYAERDSRFKIFKRADNLPKGGNACRNYAFELSQGEFINWFDSDDILCKTCIDSRVKILKSHALHFVACNGFLIRNGGAPVQISSLKNNNVKSIQKLYFTGFPVWLIQGVLFRRDFLEQNRIKFNVQIFYQQDLIFNISILDVNKIKFKFIFNCFDWIWRIDDHHFHVSQSPSKNDFISLNVFLNNYIRYYSRLNFSNVVSQSFISLRLLDLQNKDVSCIVIKLYFCFMFNNLNYFSFKFLLISMCYLLSLKINYTHGFLFFKRRLKENILENKYFLN